MDTIPTDYGVIAAKVIPALTGGATLFFIGVSSVSAFYSANSIFICHIYSLSQSQQRLNKEH